MPEPLVDWQADADRQHAERHVAGNHLLAGLLETYPAEKIETACMKTAGIPPSLITTNAEATAVVAWLEEDQIPF